MFKYTQEKGYYNKKKHINHKYFSTMGHNFLLLFFKYLLVKIKWDTYTCNIYHMLFINYII